MHMLCTCLKKPYSSNLDSLLSTRAVFCLILSAALLKLSSSPPSSSISISNDAIHIQRVRACGMLELIKWAEIPQFPRNFDYQGQLPYSFRGRCSVHSSVKDAAQIARISGGKPVKLLDLSKPSSLGFSSDREITLCFPRSYDVGRGTTGTEDVAGC